MTSRASPFPGSHQRLNVCETAIGKHHRAGLSHAAAFHHRLDPCFPFVFWRKMFAPARGSVSAVRASFLPKKREGEKKNPSGWTGKQTGKGPRSVDSVKNELFSSRGLCCAQLHTDYWQHCWRKCKHGHCVCTSFCFLKNGPISDKHFYSYPHQSQYSTIYNALQKVLFVFLVFSTSWL